MKVAEMTLPHTPVSTQQQFEQAFGALLDPLTTFALGRFGEREAALDAVQSAFTGLYKTLQRGTPVRSMKAYVYRAVHNLAVNHHRSATRVPLSLESAGLELIMPQPDPVEVARLENVFAHIQQLPDEQRLALELKYFHQLTAEEIGEIAGCSPHTAASRIKLAIAKLQTLCQQE